MTKKEFIKLAVRGGYSDNITVSEYVKKCRKKEYTYADIEAVYHEYEALLNKYPSIGDIEVEEYR